MEDNLDTINPQDWNTVAPHFATLTTEELTPDGIGDWLMRWSDLEKVLGEAGATAGRAKSEDTTDKNAEAVYLNFVQNVVPHWTVAAQALKTKLLAVPGYTPLPEHEQFLRRLRNDADLFRADNVPIQAQLQTLGNDYDKLTGPMIVSLGGEEMTLPQAEQHGLDSDRAVREEAWHAVQNRWLESRTDLDALYLKMLPLRRQLAKNAGLPDYRAYMWRALRRFDYTPEDSLAFGNAIETEVVPLAQKILETRRQTLGVDTLRPWDLNVDPAGRTPLRPFADVAALEAVTAQIFAKVDPDLGQDFEKLRHGFLDLDSRKGKAPGGYCSFFPKTGLPYIFMNAVGTESDIRTLLHEGGHAFHGLASSAAQPLLWNRGAPMEFNEVASMAMELLALPYLDQSQGGFYTPEDADRARQEQLEKIVLFLPYMAVVDGFQHWVYAEAPENVTAADMDAQWGSLWDRFMGGVDWSGLEAERVSGWHRKLHIFTVPFYYVEYGLAQLGALQVWRNALTDQADAVKRYRAALALGNTRPLPELYAAAGARLAFDPETVGELAQLVASHLEG
ncbi:MAG: M3 family oligoendopeptidase [Janthinobacterium lividum]